jgi:hypothetical protein
MGDPELVEYYTRALRGGFTRAFGSRVSEAHEQAMLESLLGSAERLAEQLDHSILDAPWLRAEAMKIVDEWIHQPGETLELGDLRESLSPMFSASRALTIARSETANVYNGAFAAGLRAHGWTHITWIAADDACPECSEMDGQTISLAEYEADPTLHPNCSCSGEPSMGDDDEAAPEEEEAE